MASLVAFACAWTTVTIWWLARDDLRATLHLTLIDLTNNLRTIQDRREPLARRDQAASELPGNIHTVRALTQGPLGLLFLVVGPDPTLSTIALTQQAQAALARHQLSTT